MKKGTYFPRQVGTYLVRLSSVFTLPLRPLAVNLSHDKTLKYSLLVPHMIERYGFHEGHGTPYRVEPEAVAQVLEWTGEKQVCAACGQVNLLDEREPHWPKRSKLDEDFYNHWNEHH